MRKTLVLLAIIVSILSSCRKDRSLKRDQAKALVLKADVFSKPATEAVALGADFRNFDMLGVVNWGLTDDLVAYRYLTREGKNVTLGPENRAESEKWGKDPDRPNVRLVPIATPVLADITGIVQAEDAIDAKADFTWHYKWEGIGALMADAEMVNPLTTRMIEKYDGRKQHKGVAEFRRYDDGWRLQAVQNAD